LQANRSGSLLIEDGVSVFRPFAEIEHLSEHHFGQAACGSCPGGYRDSLGTGAFGQ
jgi:hypothetical protein